MPNGSPPCRRQPDRQRGVHVAPYHRVTAPAGTPFATACGNDTTARLPPGHRSSNSPFFTPVKNAATSARPQRQGTGPGARPAEDEVVLVATRVGLFSGERHATASRGSLV